MFCKNCGQKVPDNAAFCPKCGQNVGTATVKTTPAPTPIYQPQAPIYQPQQSPVYRPQQVPAYQSQSGYQAQPAAVAVAAVRPKKHGGLIALLIVIIVLLGGFIAVTFLVPGLVLPVNLGVKSTYEGYVNAMDKLGLQKDEAPKTGEAEDYSVVYSGSHAVDTALTSEELTSFVTENRPPYFAVKNVQIRINEDGTIEASGKLETSYVFEQVLDGNYTIEDAKRALPMLGLIPANVNLYAKFTGSVVDNHIEGLDVDSISVMGITIPNDLIESNETFIVDTIDGFIERVNAKSGADIELMAVENGKLDIKGNMPSYIERVPLQ